MIEHVIWAPKAKKDYNKNIDYLLLSFPIEAATNFIQEVEHTIHLIQQGNITFVSTEYKEVYKIVIVPQITLFYRIYKESNTLQLARFWNNKKDPKTFSLE